MPTRKDRLSILKGTGQASRGIIEGESATGLTFAEILAPIGAPCEGYGDEIGEIGGYGNEETGYGSPCVVEGWSVAAVLEEGIPFSEVSDIDPSGQLSVSVREDGGELIVLGSTSPITPGPHTVMIQPVGTTHELRAYSGVRGQGYVIYPDTERNELVFVAPLTTQLGPANIILSRISGTVTITGLLTYIPFSRRSGTTFLQSLLPKNWLVGSYDPSLT